MNGERKEAKPSSQIKNKSTTDLHNVLYIPPLCPDNKGDKHHVPLIAHIITTLCWNSLQGMRQWGAFSPGAQREQGRAGSRLILKLRKRSILMTKLEGREAERAGL